MTTTVTFGELKFLTAAGNGAKLRIEDPKRLDIG